MTTRAILRTCPAYDVIEPRRDYAGTILLKAGEDVALLGSRDLYSPNSVASYAIESGRCPIKAIERSLTRGERMHWLTQNATSITLMRQERKTYVGVNLGDVVKFEGRRFEIVAEPNRNLNLKELPGEE